MHNRLFRDWVHPKLDLLLLVIISICLGATSGVSSTISVYMVSDLAANPADANMTSYAYLAGMAVSFPLIVTLRNYFSSKELLIFICCILLFFNFTLSKTDNTFEVVIASFFIGIARLMGSIIMVVNIIPILMPRGERYQMYAVYYPLSLIVSPLAGMFQVWLADELGWRYSFHFSNIFLFVTLLVTFLLVSGRMHTRRIPLWKFDWFSLFLLSGWMLSFTYVMVYGRTDDWLDSPKIRFAAISALVLLLLFLLRNKLRRHKIIDFTVFRFRNVRVGIVMMFLSSVFFSLSTLINSLLNITYASNPLENASVNAYPILGYITGAVVAFLYFRKYNNFKILLLATVFCYLLSTFMLYQIVDRQTEPYRFFLPMFLRGIAILLSYMTVGLYLAVDISSDDFSMSATILIFVRSFLGPVIFGGIYSTLLYYHQVQILDKLASWVDQSDPLFQLRFPGLHHNVDPILAYKELNVQASLSAIKELYGWVCIIGICMFIILIFFPIHKKQSRNIFNWGKTKNEDEIASTAVL
ncbi:MFS transporter [Chryseobacterium sp. RG1]|uniref:MFS transporter n=1 Tax=Chryseobacterium tagetis TaxID=2801334 RepID=A0ABS8A1X6_9FLAO|nr:MFS transporter [Chryseobacterium tagetis]MCA6067979.1 MFS transporter [Chryseobacterium tagetis]